jgi:hypothetical protein
MPLTSGPRTTVTQGAGPSHQRERGREGGGAARVGRGLAGPRGERGRQAGQLGLWAYRVLRGPTGSGERARLLGRKEKREGVWAICGHGPKQ